MVNEEIRISEKKSEDIRESQKTEKKPVLAVKKNIRTSGFEKKKRARQKKGTSGT